MIFTTKGFLPDEEVVLRETVVHDDDKITLTRIDKYLKETDEWVGNDIRGDVKAGFNLGAIAQHFGDNGDHERKYGTVAPQS